MEGFVSEGGGGRGGLLLAKVGFGVGQLGDGRAGESGEGEEGAAGRHFGRDGRERGQLIGGLSCEINWGCRAYGLDSRIFEGATCVKS